MKGHKFRPALGARLYAMPQPQGSTDAQIDTEDAEFDIMDSANGFVGVLVDDGNVKWIPSASGRVILNQTPTPVAPLDKILGDAITAMNKKSSNVYADESSNLLDEIIKNGR